MNRSESRITLNREELYKEVWSQPVTVVAEKYAISGRGLAKICSKLKIPTPPRGYWAKLHSGFRVQAIPLPRISAGEPVTHVLERVTKKIALPEMSPEATALVESSSLMEKEILVSSKLHKPHPLIQKSRQLLTQKKPDEYGRVRSWEEGTIDLRVGPKSLERALRIMDAIVKKFENMGLLVLFDNSGSPRTYVRIFNENVFFSMSEKALRKDHVPTAEDKREMQKYTFHLVPRWDYFPTGKLTLEIHYWGVAETRKKWSDMASRPLEKMVNDFLLGVIRVADLLHQRRLLEQEVARKLEEARQAREEMERQRRLEEKRLYELEAMVDRWIKSQHLRAFIDEIEKQVSHRPLPQESRECCERWVSWATQHADRLDPLHDVLPWVSANRTAPNNKDPAE